MCSAPEVIGLDVLIEQGLAVDGGSNVQFVGGGRLALAALGGKIGLDLVARGVYARVRKSNSFFNRGSR